MSSMHEMIYADPGRVRQMRVEAEGRIGARRIRFALVDVWAEPVAAWILSVHDRGVSAKNALRWGRRH